MACLPSLHSAPGRAGRQPINWGTVHWWGCTYRLRAWPGRQQQHILPWCLGESGYCIMGSIRGRGDKSQEPICIQKVHGPAQTYWQALLTGDQEVVAEILSNSQNNLSPNAVFDTSDLEEWKNYRFNIRWLSMQGAASRQRAPPQQGLRAFCLCCRAFLLLGLCVMGALWILEE